MMHAFVLHTLRFRETSAIIRMFSAQEGLVSTIKKGAYRSTKTPVPTTFQQYDIAYVGRGNLKTLTRCEAATKPYLLRGPLSVHGLYINELMLRVLPEHDAQPSIWHAYCQTIAALACGSDPAICLRTFEWQVIAGLGYQIDFAHDSYGQPIDPNGYYVLNDDHTLTPTLRTNYALSGTVLAQLFDNNYSNLDTQRIAYNLAQRILQHILGRQLRFHHIFNSKKQYATWG